MTSTLYEYLTLSNFFLLGVFFLIGIAYKVGFKSVKPAVFVLVGLSLMATTHFFPAKLMANYEDKVAICYPQQLDTTPTYYLHVLGAGYSLDPRLPATGQLSTITLARLVESIRIARSIPNYKIVTSAYSSLGLESQASVAQRAAIELGIPAKNTAMLPTPSNTAEEVAAFVKQFGTHKKVIVVSDALHLTRALMLYKKAGITAIPAPTNFKIKQGPSDYNGLTFPSLSSLDLMNEYFREQLKYWKDKW
jgi:uncharacterized SAM-binding protein YcdF (DUF218 family)